MTVVLLTFIVLCLVTAKYKNPFNKETFENNFDKDCTECINGIFVVLVFLSHFHWEIEQFFTIDKLYNRFQQICGQCIVCSFLFFTGYGIYEGLKKDRCEYAKKLVTVKFPKLLLRFDFCVLLYAITQIALGNSFSIKTLILSLLTISNLGNSNWYISYVLLLYVITWIAFTIFKDDRKSLAFITACMMLYVILFWIFYRIAAHYYFTSFIYPLGIFWSMKKEKIGKIISSKFVFIFSIVFFVYFAVWFCNGKFFLPQNMFYNLVSLFFTITLITITYKIQLKNHLLSLLGKNVFEVYIMQHLPMIIFKPIQQYGGGYVIYLLLCIAGTALLTGGVKVIFRKVRIF